VEIQAEDVTTSGSYNVTLDVEEQPFASVTVAVCDPTAKPVTVVAAPSALLHKYVQVPTPPDGDTSATPSDNPKQLTSAPFCCNTCAVVVTTSGSINATLAVEEQPFKSVTVTVCQPAAKPLTVVTTVSALLHK
jgi:hypothetical protein